MNEADGWHIEVEASCYVTLGDGEGEGGRNKEKGRREEKGRRVAR